MKNTLDDIPFVLHLKFFNFIVTIFAEALKGMEKVAEHINEMQRIHEEYGAIFDHLFRQHQKACKQPIDLSPGELNCSHL